MVRCRILAVPLAFVVAIAVFISPCLAALPNNNYIQNYNMVFSDDNGDTGSLTFQTGSVVGVAHSSPSSFSSGFDIQINFLLTGSTNLYCFRSSNLGFTSSISSYADSSGHYDDSASVSQMYQVSFNNGVFSSTTYTNQRTFSGRVFKFVNPPAGNINFHFSYAGDFLVNSGVCVGVFVDAASVPLSNIVDDYINGSLTFEEAIENLNDSYRESVADDPDSQQKQLAIMQYELDRLVLASDNKNLSDIKDNVTDSFNNTLGSFSSGTIDLIDAMEDLNTTYQDALSNSATPIQGILVNTTYQISLKKLEIEARQRAYDKLDSAISDEQLTEADDYYAAEEVLIDQFALAEFESALTFDLWLHALPPSESSLYKQFFDYLFNESSVRFFLIVPISLVLVRILVGSSLYLGHKRSS